MSSTAHCPLPCTVDLIDPKKLSSGKNEKKHKTNFQNNQNVIQKVVTFCFLKFAYSKWGAGGSPDPNQAKYMKISPFGLLF